MSRVCVKSAAITTFSSLQPPRQFLDWIMQLRAFVFLVLILTPGVFSESLQAPRFISQPSSSSNIVSEGRTKILQCQALGYPQPEYRWLRDGEPLTEFLPEHFYKIQTTRREDAGSYQCVARNDVGSILSDKIDVTVAYMGLFEDVSERTVQVAPGGAAILELPPIESHPPPSVTWQTADSPLPYDRKFVVTVQHQLVVLAADEGDEKAYRARATNTQLGKEENSAYIRLALDRSESATALFDDADEDHPPVIVIGPMDQRIVRGQSSVELQCIANARSLHELDTIWLKDGIPLESSDPRYSYNDPWNRTLSLLNADPSHTGKYECRARLRSSRGREQQEAVASASVTVLEKPSFSMSLRPETLGDFGSALTLGCQAVGTPRPNVTWYRNTEAVGLQPGSRFEVQEDGSLIIKRLLMEDSGMFQCVASNEAGETSTYTWLKVKTAAPVMESPPANITVLDGKDATISCRALGAPTPNTTWYFQDGKPIDATHRRAQILEVGDLLIAAVRSADAGQYTCVRANEAGQVNASAWISVLVRTQIIQPPADTRVILGHTATMQCKVSSDESVPYQVFWSRNKETIIPKPGSRIRQMADGTLMIGEVRAADVGDYTCVVSSPGGNDTRSAKLKVIELPYAPVSIRAHRVPNSKNVSVSWTPGFDGNSPILKYIIQRREVPDTGPIPYPPLSWVTELANVSATERSVVLHHLRAAASYQFRVSAVNSVGEGTASDPSEEVMLPQERPSGPPQGLVGSARSPSEIIIQWQPPLEQHRNGLILGYIVRYRLYGYLDSPWSYRNVTNEAQRNYLIQELITWKDYEVQIAAYNDKGIGVYSDSIKIKTKEGVPEAPPVNVRVKAINSTAVQVWWTPPDPQKINGINQGYKLQAWKGSPDEAGTDSKTISVPPSLLDPLAEQTTIISGLEKYSCYNLTVLCFTDPGDGDRSVPVEIQTNEDVPGPVTNLHFDEISDRAVMVIWGVPTQTNGILTGYTLTYMVRDDPGTQQSIELAANTTRLKIDKLQPTTHYRIDVSAHTSVGKGPPTSATIQSGVEPVLPGPPSHLAVTNIEAFSVVLQFTPGFDGNSSIIKWIIEAQTVRNSTWTVIHEVSDPEATTLLVPTLTPFMKYSLRLLAVNVVGASPPSEPTKDFQTIQAPPQHPPRNVTVRAMSATELRVRWIPLQQLEWFGNPRGFNITFIGPDMKVRNFVIEDHTANSHVLSGLEEFAEYHIQMVAFNDVGASRPSPAAKERTRESVPSFGPLGVEANATSSTTIVVRWGEVPKEHENGIIEGFKVYYGADSRSPFQYKDIPKNSTFTTTLTELRKYVTYHIQVLAYTRLGDGVLSIPPVRVLTFEDTPGPPSNVSFPDVSFTTARIIWDVPYDPNGEILAYVVTYHLNDDRESNFSREFPPSDRTYRATELQPEQYYMFSVRAQTRLGWGKTAHALVYTTNNREPPQAPSAPQVSSSQVQSEQITFSWTPGRDGFAPLRYYTVQRAEGPNGPWITVPERVDPQMTSYTVTELRPYTVYRFRIQATNDMGPSGWSQESPITRTLPAAPSRGVQNLKVVPITTTSVRVQWEPIAEQFWSGDHKTGGYKIVFQPVSHYPTALQASQAMQFPGVHTGEAVLGDLLRDCTYEIVVLPYNSQGLGPATPPATVYVGEAVPTGQPRDVTAEAVSSTEVRLSWRPPPAGQQNGELLGYKIFYVVIGHPAVENSNEATHVDSTEGAEQELEVVPAPSVSHSLVFLDQFTRYRVHIVAFNPAGDGPPSAPVTVTTLQGLPGPPANLTFTDITMTSLRVSWDPPVRRNGEILGYVVTYETAEQNDKFSKQVKQKVSGASSLAIQNLEEEVTYTFWVRAQTLDYGPATTANVTTGPQDGSPAPPRELLLARTAASTAIDLSWVNGPSGKGPILGYYMESKRKAVEEDLQIYDTRWQTVARTKNGPLTEFSVSYQNLLPSTSYMFRVIAYNRFGVSCPSYTNEEVLTPSKLYLDYGYLQYKPFYRQTWFMVALAASSIVIIIAIIAVLCVKSKSFKYKQEAAQKSMEETLRMEQDDSQDHPIEMYNQRSYRNFSQQLLGSVGRGKGRPPAVPMLGKSPPRPSPASVAYHSDEDSVKGYDENPDDSSVTEKPSELSSTDSQATDSDNDSEASAPHSFVNHYANVNDSLRQSWKRQRPAVRNYSSYTDSEPEPMGVSSHPGGSVAGSSAAAAASASTLNGGQIVMNNKARSRAPLPGFSSFV